MMLYTKYESSGPFSFRKDFKNCILKTFFLPCDLLKQTNQNHLNDFGRGPRLLSLVKFPFAVQVKKSFPYIFQCKIKTPGMGIIFDPRGII